MLSGHRDIVRADCMIILPASRFLLVRRRRSRAAHDMKDEARCYADGAFSLALGPVTWPGEHRAEFPLRALHGI